MPTQIIQQKESEHFTGFIKCLKTLIKQTGQGKKKDFLVMKCFKSAVGDRGNYTIQ